MLHEGYHMSPHEGQEEFDEVNEELRKKEEVEGRGGSLEQEWYCFYEKYLVILPKRRKLLWEEGGYFLP